MSISIYLFNRFYYHYTFSFEQFLAYLAALPLSWYLILVVCSIVNWGLESYKWKFLVSRLEEIRYKDAIKSVLSGVAVSQLLPYRTGEYLGRLAYISDKNKIGATALSIIGSYSQLLVTLLLGFWGFCRFSGLIYPTYLFVIGLPILLAILLIVYFTLPGIKRFKDTKIGTALSLVGSKDLVSLLSLSLIRYLTFVIPYAMLAQHYDLAGNWGFTHYFGCVMAIYFMQTVTPNFILTDIALRLTLPVAVFHFANRSAGMEYVPGMLIYIFNVAIPMCIGAVILMLARIRR